MKKETEQIVIVFEEVKRASKAVDESEFRTAISFTVGSHLPMVLSAITADRHVCSTSMRSRLRMWPPPA